MSAGGPLQGANPPWGQRSGPWADGRKCGGTPMSWQSILTAMLPEHLLLVGIVLLLVLEIASDKPRGALALSLVVVGAAAAAAAWLHFTGYAAAPFPGHFSVDASSSLAKAVVLALAVPVLLLARDDFPEGPFYPLFLSSLYGFCLLLSSDSFLTLFLGLEIMSLPVYVLVLLAFGRPESPEAALKYLVLGGTASAMFLMGVSLLYGGSATLALSSFAAALGVARRHGDRRASCSSSSPSSSRRRSSPSTPGRPMPTKARASR